MSSSAAETARAWVLAKRPRRAAPEASAFALRRVPLKAPAEQEVQIDVACFSLDPGMRPRLTHASYLPALKLGDVIEASGIGTVRASRSPHFARGDWVMGGFGWCEALTLPQRRVQKLAPHLFGKALPRHTAIGVLGVSGLTAYLGLRKHAALSADATLLISSAAGAVGTTAGQVARLLQPGVRVVGITSRGKAAALRRVGFDEVVIHSGKSPQQFARALTAACPDGVDVYFDNVGGSMLNSVLAQMRRGGRIIACGAVSQYHTAAPEPMRDSLRFITHRLQMTGFVVYDYAKEFPAAQTQLAQWIKSKQLHYDETVIDGIEHAPRRYAEVLQGKHTGRSLIRVLPEGG